jgi:hypothetical protein
MVRGVEACLWTVFRAASTQSDLVLNCDNGVQVSWDDAGLVVWFQSIQAALSIKAQRLTALSLIDFSLRSYSFYRRYRAAFPGFNAARTACLRTKCQLLDRDQASSQS